MCIESKYLVSQFKKLKTALYPYSSLDQLCFVFKNYYEIIDENGEHHRIWDQQDLKLNMHYAKKTIIGLSLYNDAWMTSWINIANKYIASIGFDYAWKEIGRFIIPCDYLLKDSFDQFIKSIYVQLLMMIDKGKNIYVDRTLLFKKHSTYEILTETDFNT